MSPKDPARYRRALYLPLLSVAALVGVTGCGMGPAASPNPVQMVTMNGTVHGGQQAVTGSMIQLYAVGNGGNGSAATPLLSGVTSGASGFFSITGDYTCPSANAQVYIVATGGNPGLGAGGDNPALALVAALGSCGNLTPSQFIFINEVTTVAAAWTLAPFESSLANIGSSSTNAAGLANAFLNANLIVNTANGMTATLPTNLTTESGKIYALADAVASCVSSDGGSACTPLFSAATPSGGIAPTNTWDAAINIVRHPGNNVSGVFTAIAPQPPFPTTLTGAPNDWTLSLTVTGGGLNQPTALGVDGEGNVWVTGYNGPLSGFNPQGTPLSAAGYGSTVLAEDYGLTVDPSGNVWVSVEQAPPHNVTQGSVVEFLGVSAGSAMGNSTVFADNSIDFPFGIAADTNGNILVANDAVASSGPQDAVTVVNPTANTFTGLTGNGEIEGSTVIAPDTLHGMWVGDRNNGLTHMDTNGNVLATQFSVGPISGLALDSAGNVWATSNASASDCVVEVGPTGTLLQSSITGGGISDPNGIAVDAAQNVWIANYYNEGNGSSESFTELAGSMSSSPGTPLSPSTGFGLDANLIDPFGIVLDPSGDIWISSEGGNALVEFLGLAAPTKTPQPPLPTAP
jgi:hypothetical protein